MLANPETWALWLPSANWHWNISFGVWLWVCSQRLLASLLPLMLLFGILDKFSFTWPPFIGRSGDFGFLPPNIGIFTNFVSIRVQTWNQLVSVRKLVNSKAQHKHLKGIFRSYQSLLISASDSWVPQWQQQRDFGLFGLFPGKLFRTFSRTLQKKFQCLNESFIFVV